MTWWEDDEEIKDKSEVKVPLFEKSSDITKPQTVALDVSKDVEIDVDETYECKIIHTE